MDGFLQLLLVSAATAGLLGGAHCAVMCGGIVGAMCGGAAGMSWTRTLAYNAGRIASYALAGAIVGAVGQAGLALRGGMPVRHALMTAAGLTLVVLALFLAGWQPLVRVLEGAGGVLWRRLQPLTRHVLPADTVPRALGLGLLWGWLPCGMVYGVLLTAAATGSARDGALVMAAFGLGTLPNLVAMAAFARQMQRYARVRWVRYAGAAVVGAFGLYGLAHAVRPNALALLSSCIGG
jgi:sulfite exporter TauE/SafE